MADKRKNNLKNLGGHKFPKAPQKLEEAKSNGQVNLSIKRNLIETLRSRIDEWDLVDKVVSGVNSEVDNGNLKNAIELLKIAKEPEKQDINLTASKGVTVEVANNDDKGLIEGI